MATIRSPHVSPFVTGGLTALGLLGAIYASVSGHAAPVPAGAQGFMIGWLALSTALTLFVTPRNFIVGFLAGLLSMLIGWRIGGFYGVAVVWVPLLAAMGATLYFLIATLVGGHFGMGFIWASPGGGWEYPVLMMVLFLSFVARGAGRFSVDGVLIDAGRMPAGLRFLAVPRN